MMNIHNFIVESAVHVNCICLTVKFTCLGHVMLLSSQHACRQYDVMIIVIFILPQVLLVTGGRDAGNILDSTEVLRPGSDWQEITSASLPRPLQGVRVITVDNRVLLFGEWRHISILTAPS